MGLLQILQHGRNRRACMSNDALPIYYMSDYSVLGLLVADLDQARQVLAGHQFAVTDRSDHLEVGIDRPGQILAIADLLNRKGIDCEPADIVDQVYQG